MSWFALIDTTAEYSSAAPVALPLAIWHTWAPAPQSEPQGIRPMGRAVSSAVAPRDQRVAPRSATLGSAYAGAAAWVGSATTPPAAPTPTLAEDVTDAIAQAARASGRTEYDVWLEAAREWLSRRAYDDEPPPTAPAAASLPHPRRQRTWAEIDTLLGDLRLSAPASTAA